MKKVVVGFVIFFSLNAGNPFLEEFPRVAPPSPLAHLTRITEAPFDSTIKAVLKKSRELLIKASPEECEALLAALSYYQRKATIEDLGPFGEEQEKEIITLLLTEHPEWEMTPYRLPMTEKSFAAWKEKEYACYLFTMKWWYLGDIVKPKIGRLLEHYSTGRSEA